MILENPSGATTPFLIIGVSAVVLLTVAVKVTDWKDM